MTSAHQLEQLLDQTWQYRREQNLPLARQTLAEAEAICPGEDHLHLGRIKHIHMQFAADSDNNSEAIEYCQQAINHYQKANNPDKEAHAVRHLADLQASSGHLNQAESNYRQAFSLYQCLPEARPLDMANTCRGFALLLERKQKSQEAKLVWQLAEDNYRECGVSDGVEEAQRHLAK